jgi:hypothetical protein
MRALARSPLPRRPRRAGRTSRGPSHNIPKHRDIVIAAGVTFFVLLAIFPAIAAMVAIYGLLADPSTVSQHVNDLSFVTNRSQSLAGVCAQPTLRWDRQP